jgi:hypothetical protein
MTEQIGKLERLPLRDVWKHEAYDFTQWLEDNIDVLNDVLDLTLVNVEREKKTESTFSVDLVAEDAGGGTVVIENQLEKSNHDHLGKVITYLVAMSARAAIWIVSDPRPEHVAAVNWLNEGSGASFYLLKVEAVRIGASPPAPLLTVIVAPSENYEEVGRTKQELDERYRTRQAWWSQLVQRQDAKLHAHITPGMYSWLGTSSGVRGLGFNYTVLKKTCGAELYIDRGKGTASVNREIFDQLQANREAIEQAFGEPLSWEALEAKRACRIKYALDGGYQSHESEWEATQAKQVNAMNRLHAALQPYISRLDVEKIEADVEEREEAAAQ